MKVIRAKSAGFCWGVERAIEVAREQSGGGNRRVYTDGPLIHNKQMMQALGKEDIQEVGDYRSSGELNLEQASSTLCSFSWKMNHQRMKIWKIK